MWLPSGTSRFQRTMPAYRLPIANISVIDTRYSRPIRLWSVVSSQDLRSQPSFR